MKIAVVGCGAVGSYYGARLARAGHAVHFLLRSDYTVVRQRGLSIRSAAGSFHLHPLCAQTPEAIGPVELVLIALKTTANYQFPNLLPPLAGPDTALLTLQNGLGNEEQLAQLFRPQQILGGLAFVCLNRIEPGLVHHIDYGAITIGEFAGSPTARTHEFATMFRQAGVPCEVAPDLAQAHWEKLGWNIPFNGLGVAASAGYEAVASGNPQAISSPPLPCLTTDKLLGDARWHQLVCDLIEEVVGAGRALGFPIPDTLASKHLNRTATMGAYKPSTVLDFECGRPIELDSLFLEPLRQACQAGVKTPRLRAMCEVLKVLQKH